MTSSDGRPASRRQVLHGVGAMVGFTAPGALGNPVDDPVRDSWTLTGRCPEATLRPELVHYDHSIHEVCSDDHPETRALQAAVESSLETEFPTVGALLDAGFIPYFDFFAEGSWSHWLNPGFIADDSMVDPERPGSILVDHTWWRPIGVMFIATADGERRDPPPTVYEDDGACVPWHAHIGFPGRYAWWKHQAVAGHVGEFPCRTPWMMHVWTHPHSESLYAHSAPEDRGGPPAEDPGFATDADPDEEELGPEHLPDAIRSKWEDVWSSVL